MTTTAKQIKKLYAEYKEAAAEENAVFENENSTEREIDTAIEKTVKAEMAFQYALSDFTNGAITNRDVMRMMVFKKDELDNLISRLAA